MEVHLHAVLKTLALDGCEWFISRTGRFVPRGKFSRYPLDRRWRGPQILCWRRGNVGNQILVVQPVT